MKIICPKCSSLIEPENINVQKDYAFCNVCQNVFNISSIVDVNDGQYNKISRETARISEETVKISEEMVNNPPKGAWKYENYDRIVIGASTRSPAAFFLIPFMAIWSVASIGGIYITQIIRGEFNLILSLVGIPFLAATVFLGSIALMTIAGKVNIVIGRDSYVFRGIGIIGTKKRFDWNSVAKIYEEEHSENRELRNSEDGIDVMAPPRTITSIFMEFMEGEKRINIGKGLKREHKYYLFTALKYFHENRRKYSF